MAVTGSPGRKISFLQRDIYRTMIQTLVHLVAQLLSTQNSQLVLANWQRRKNAKTCGRSLWKEWKRLFLPFHCQETSHTLPAQEAPWSPAKCPLSSGTRFSKHIAMLYSDPILIIYIGLGVYSGAQL